MRKLLTNLLTITVVGSASVVLLVFASIAAASSLTFYPNDINGGADTIGIFGDYPSTEWATGSWKANGVSYSKIYMTPSQLFGRDVAIGELAYISYYTKKDTTHTDSAPDWFFQMYTKPYTGSPGSSWYGNRINSEPYFSENLNDPANTWNKWQTDDGEDNRLRFFDSSAGYFGGYTDPFLSDLTSNSDYSNQELLYIVVGTGTGWAQGFEGQLDGLHIELNGGETADVNFEPIPEPTTIALIGFGLLGLIGYSVHRKKKS